MMKVFATQWLSRQIGCLFAIASLLVLPGFISGYAASDSKPPLTMSGGGFLLRGSPFVSSQESWNTRGSHAPTGAAGCVKPTPWARMQ